MVNIGKRFFSLDHENGIVEGQANLKAYITKFIRNFLENLRLVSLL